MTPTEYNSRRQSLSSLPYSERQMIMVTEDEVVDALYQVEFEEQDHDDHHDHDNQYVRLALDIIKNSARALSPLSVVLEKLIFEAIDAWKRAREDGIPIRMVGKSEASKLTFPPGHPRNKVMYIAHPAIPDLYYTTANFHRVVFEHKFSEAIRLLMHLGANQLRVEHICGWSKEFSSRLSVPLEHTSVALDANMDSSSNSQIQLLYEAMLCGTKEPEIPDSLVWYPHEPTWQTIAEGRLRFGLRQFSLNVNYEDDYGINAGLKASAIKAKLDLGGNFEDHEITIWRIAGRFCEDDLN